jgi:uncharacterized protein
MGPLLALVSVLLLSSPLGTAPQSPLGDAAYSGDAARVRRLLDSGVRPDETDANGATPLIRALEPFIAEPSQPMAHADAAGAARKRREGKLRAAELLMEAGADVKAREKNGLTALHLAAGGPGDESPMVPIVKDLLRHGADVDARTEAKVTPLGLAVWKRRLKIASLLISGGADLDAVDATGRTPAQALTRAGLGRELERLRGLSARRRR